MFKRDEEDPSTMIIIIFQVSIHITQLFIQISLPEQYSI